jgi:hypothetical protein
MNFWERLKMRLEKRAQKRLKEQTNGNGFIFFGDIIHGRNYPILYQRFTLIRQLMSLIIDEVKYFFQRQPEITLTDAICAWNYYLTMEEARKFFKIDDIINERHYRSYLSTSVLFPITLR